MITSRRQWIRNCSMLSLSPLVPSMLLHAANGSASESDSRILVVIQLDGGNDGINTVIPIADEAYAQNRFQTRIAPKDALSLNKYNALHPSMKAAKELYDEGRLSIVQAVGYPNPDRSHFRSMRIWQTARFEEEEQNTYGWLGRALDNAGPRAGESDAVYIGPDRIPLALWSRRSTALAMVEAEDIELKAANAFSSPTPSRTSEESIEQFVSRSVLSAYKSSDELKQHKSTGRSAVAYPDTQLSRDLKQVAQLIKAQLPTRIFYTALDGFDTHSRQEFTHAQLLDEFSNALRAFLNDLRNDNLEDRVLVMAFSEFGRRVRENDTQGTDHGTAGPVFLAGSPVKPGIVGRAPDLNDLDDGDIHSQYDFRQVYASILDRWLSVSSSTILGQEFEPLDLFKV